MKNNTKSEERCRCNNCMNIFKDDSYLLKQKDERGLFKGCPHCKTDDYLMDIDLNDSQVQMDIEHMRNKIKESR